MAIKPTDIPNVKERQLIDQAEKELDEWLTEHFTGEDTYVILPGCLPYNYRGILLDRYRKAGWRVYHKAQWGDSMGSSGALYFGAPSGQPEPV